MKLLIFVLGIISVYCSETSLKAFQNANKEFTGKLYKELLKQKQEKVLVSPVAIQLIFSLLYAGAEGKTAEELANTLLVPHDDKMFADMIDSVIEYYNSLKSDYYKLTIANKIFVNNDFKVKDSYRFKAVGVFGADVENINFKQKQDAVTIINTWVNQKTKHTIPQMVTEDDLNDALRAILLNTVYFQAPWSTPFYEEATSQETFFIDNFTTVNVDMMTEKDLYQYHESVELNAKFLKIPYQINGMSMTVVLPNEKDGLSQLENRIDNVLGHTNYSPKVVRVSFPKFEFDATIKLKPVLNAMGVQHAFDSSADFKGISETGNLFVSEAIQKNHIEVNEKGTIASSATAVFISEMSGIIETEPPKEFKANHPFIFLIGSDSGILFIGKFTGK